MNIIRIETWWKLRIFQWLIDARWSTRRVIRSLWIGGRWVFCCLNYWQVGEFRRANQGEVELGGGFQYFLLSPLEKWFNLTTQYFSRWVVQPPTREARVETASAKSWGCDSWRFMGVWDRRSCPIWVQDWQRARDLWFSEAWHWDSAFSWYREPAGRGTRHVGTKWVGFWSKVLEREQCSVWNSHGVFILNPNYVSQPKRWWYALCFGDAHSQLNYESSHIHCRESLKGVSHMCLCCSKGANRFCWQTQHHHRSSNLIFTIHTMSHTLIIYNTCCFRMWAVEEQ